MRLDGLLRVALAIPGVVFERLEPRAVPGEPLERDRVYPLVRAAAVHPEAHLALEDDLHYHVDDASQRVVAYQLRGGTAFAVGGLNAPEGARTALLKSWSAALDARGLRRRLLFPLRAPELAEAEAAGVEAVQVGVEGWLDLDGLAFRGSRYESVRNMRNRAERRGVQVTEVDGPDDEMGELYGLWLATRRPSWRMKLLIGSPGLQTPFDRRYFVARTEGRMEGFVTVLPGGPGVYGLDVMCRRPDAVSGTMERLIVEVVSVLREEGATALSLGACPMAGVPLEGNKWLLRRIFNVLYSSSLGNQLFGFRNLHRFKQKFRPRWEPVFFGAERRLGWWELYLGCRMWGLY